MKKLIVLLLVFALLFVVGCPKKEEEAEEKTEQPKVAEKVELTIMDRLPENADVLVKFGSIETLYKHFSVTETSIFGNPIEGLEAAKNAIGFNPFNLEEVKAHGFDPGKEVGVFVADITIKETGEDPQFSLLLFLPVTDAQKALDSLKASFTKEGAGFTSTQEGDLTVLEQENTQDKLYLAAKDGYLFVSASEELDAKALLETTLAGGSSLTKGKAYQNVVAKLPANEEIFLYANVAQIAEKNLETLKALSTSPDASSGAPDLSGNVDYLKDYEGAGLSLDLENPNLVIKGIANLVPDAKSKKLMEGVQVDKNALLGMAEQPVLLLSGAVNIAEYYKMIVEGFSEEAKTELKAQLEGMKEMSGIDIENDLINNLGGNVNLGVYDGSTITMGNYNALISLTVKDAAVMQGVLEKAMGMLQGMVNKQPVGDVEAYVVMYPMLPVQLFLALNGDTVVATAGKPMFEKTLDAKADSGFVGAIEDKDLADKLKKDANMLYLNVDEVMKVVKNFEMFLQGDPESAANLQKAQEAAAKFEYLFASNGLEGDSIVGNLMVKTKFAEPFFIEVSNLAKSFQQAEEPQQ